MILHKGSRRGGCAAVVAHFSPQIARRIRIDARAAWPIDEQAADLQRGVTDEFGRQSESRAAGQQWFAGIVPRERGVGRRALPIRRRSDDLADQRLRVPAVLPEIDRQPVEQSRHGGATRLGAEVGRRADDPRAEQRLPDAIDGDPRREWVLRHHHPLSQAQTIGRRVGGRRRQHGRRTRGHFLSRLRVRDPRQNKRVAGLLRLVHDHGGKLRAGAVPSRSARFASEMRSGNVAARGRKSRHATRSAVPRFARPAAVLRMAMIGSGSGLPSSRPVTARSRSGLPPTCGRGRNLTGWSHRVWPPNPAARKTSA